MSTKLRQTIYGGAIMGAQIRSESAREADAIESLFSALNKTSRWRSKLADQYPDLRNARAAARLTALADKSSSNGLGIGTAASHRSGSESFRGRAGMSCRLAKPVSQQQLYEIHTARHGEVVNAVLTTRLIPEITRREND